MEFRGGDALQFTLTHALTAVPRSEFEQTRAEWQPRQATRLQGLEF